MEGIWKSKYLRVLTLILLAQAVLFYSASHGDSRPLRQPLKQFPKTLPGWQAVTDGLIDADTVSVLKADDILRRFYVRPPVPDFSRLSPEMKAALVNGSDELFIAYFSSQQTGQSPHSPKNCLPGSGWQPSETGELAVQIPGLAAPITINKYIVSQGEASSVVLYWYQSHGRVVANEFAAKFYLVTDSMRYHRSDTALVRITVAVKRDGVEPALKSALDLVQAAYPAILNYLPN